MKVFKSSSYFSYYNNRYSNERKKEFYSNFISAPDLNSVYDLLNIQLDQSFFTNKKIEAHQLSFGLTPFKIFLKLGRARCTFLFETGNIEHQVNIYKGLLDKYSYYTICHFINSKLTIIQLSFPNMEMHVENDILSTLERKYQITLSENKKEALIYNMINDRIIIKNDVHLNLFYLPGTSNILQVIEKEMALRKKNKEIQYKRQLRNLESLV